ncbi:MAG: hypothetical protein KC492_37695, partial [Myxococcales bacterium]|nr:hypothetical protein [Myxococcales bacterium]
MSLFRVPTTVGGGGFTRAAQRFVDSMAQNDVGDAFEQFSSALGPFARIFEFALGNAYNAVLTIDAHLDANSTVDDLLAIPWEALTITTVRGEQALVGERALIVRAGEFNGQDEPATRGPSASPTFRVVTVSDGRHREVDAVAAILSRPTLNYGAERFTWTGLPIRDNDDLYLHVAGPRPRRAAALVDRAADLQPSRLGSALGPVRQTLLVANTCSSFFELGGVLHDAQRLRRRGACGWPASVPALTLVATMWTVQDDAAAAWGEAFFHQLRHNGASIGEALLAVRHTQEPKRSALAYAIHGDPDLVPFPRLERDRRDSSS